MNIIDASGEIYDEMWGYGSPFPSFKIKEIELPEWVNYTSYSQAFEGFHMLTGTYIAAPSHGLGLEKSYPVSSVKIEDLYETDAYVLKFDLNDLHKEGNNPYVSYEDILKAEKKPIGENKSILISAGWGSHWRQDDYLKNYWFLKKDALEYLLAKKPFILGIDSPSIDNLNNSQGLLKKFFNHDVLLLAPLVNMEKVKNFEVKLTVCPLNVLNTCGSPCRVIIKDN